MVECGAYHIHMHIYIYMYIYIYVHIYIYMYNSIGGARDTAIITQASIFRFRPLLDKLVSK